MRTVDRPLIEAFVREALPLATDAEVDAILARLDGRVVRPEETERVRPGQPRLSTEAKVDRLRGFIMHALTGQPGCGYWPSIVAPNVRRLVDVPAAREA